MNNSIIVIRCKHCGKCFALSKGRCGKYDAVMHGWYDEDFLDDFCEFLRKHGGNCDYCKMTYYELEENFEFGDAYTMELKDHEFQDVLYQLSLEERRK